MALKHFPDIFRLLKVHNFEGLSNKSQLIEW